MGSYYWARFEKKGNHFFRYDTRIYLEEVQNISDDDVCIGAVVGKNPGSAKPSDEKSNAMQMIYLDGDKLLPTVRNIFKKAKEEANNNEYVQVLNLFYLCDKNLGAAISNYNNFIHKPPIDSAESKEFPLVWYVWGGPDNRLDDFKSRFRNITEKHMYYHTTNGQVCFSFPDNNPARHTQGLKQANIIAALGTKYNQLFTL